MSEKETILLVAKDIYLAHQKDIVSHGMRPESVTDEAEKAFGLMVAMVARVYGTISSPASAGQG